MSIISKTVEGSTYYTTTSRGTVYSLRYHAGQWELHSKRLALGSSSMGSFRFFDSLHDLEAAVTAFRGIEKLILPATTTANAIWH
ncbi:hypothetical protein EGJ86_19380 [Pseudomonas sp. o96-267]|uniref:hypothetical protein n=1 Tax=Pseudomonas sp. o96-267 TaxID=2479853 RepID=UPI000F7910DF|nr:MULTISPECIES: hypothetical protein [Pseudomonas]MDH0959069.1 hypothetical protein [Pseudomonas chengduensis]MDV5863623.1 hypothetical protein [Pseudomonas mendocina]RRV31735.1 hypothetical protein EGJ86_19380 [Pseudomonas sp. o96-267]